jgi:hypothetical protein
MFLSPTKFSRVFGFAAMWLGGNDLMIVVIADIWLSIGTTARDVTILLALSELDALVLNFMDIYSSADPFM